MTTDYEYEILTTGMDNLADASTGLEEIYSTIDLFLKEGGITQPTMAMASLAIDQCRSKSPFFKKTVIPGLEELSFGDDCTVQAIFGLESLASDIKVAVDFTIKMIAKFVAFIKDIWNRWRLNAGRLKDKATALIKVLRESKIKGNIVEELRLSEEIWLNLNQKEKINVQEIITGIKELGKTVDEAGGSTSVTDFTTYYLEEVSILLEKNDEDSNNSNLTGKDKNTIEHMVDQISTFSLLRLKKDVYRNNTYVSENIFIGNKRVEYKFRAQNGVTRFFNGEKAKDIFAGVSISLKDTKYTKPIAGVSISLKDTKYTKPIDGKKVKVDVLSLSDSIKVLESVVYTLDLVISCKLENDNRKKVIKTLDAHVKKARTLLTDDFKTKYPKRYSAINSFISSAPATPNAIFNPAKDLCHHSMVVCNSAIKFVEISYKVLKKQYDDSYEPDRVRDPNQRTLTDQHIRDNPYAFK